MTDIIICPQQIQIEIRFKMRLKMFFQICCHFVLIRIKKSGLRIFIQFLYHLIQCIRRKQIILIQKTNIGSGSFLYRCICIFRNSSVFTHSDQTDSFSFKHILFENFFYSASLFIRNSHTEFPVFISLPAY